MPLVTSTDAYKLSIEIFQACGSPLEEAQIVANHLVSANLSGVDSHGLIRIPQYVQDAQSGAARPGAAVTTIKETEVSAVVDCGWNFGVVGAEKAADIGIAKARSSRIAVVTTKHCNHAGRLGHYLEKIAQNQLIGFGFCSSPKHGHFVVPWGGRDGRLSTNPISYGIPSDDGPIVSDFSTSQAPEGKIRLYKNRKQNLPEGWIVDASGQPSILTSDFYGPPQGGILPFGGRQGYRGYALGLLVEIMGTILAGDDSTENRPGNGVTFMVFDPTLLVSNECFSGNLKKLKDYVRSSRPSSRNGEVLLPGEPEQRSRAARSQEGIEVESATWGAILKVAAALKVDVRITEVSSAKGDSSGHKS
jgi:hydroxycarboxylate dehydrogenase B